MYTKFTGKLICDNIGMLEKFNAVDVNGQKALIPLYQFGRQYTYPN